MNKSARRGGATEGRRRREETTHYWQSSMTMHLKFEKGSWKHRGCYTLDYPSSLTRVDSSRIWNTRTLVISHARGKYSSFSHPVYR
ncbi:uncharacterized protein LOC112552941 isoform X2 [Pogonomyrmex barbatus]|uniref:Uncharacterized protein LOC112552941 isoform X2 n=1 Tax=Pogonomyrmex barbatus TaxID=144034 RepID=A0A8N1S8U8_9HYME|nr:uncharacterized protein LOC112552941 isoform X2 [Pogonomyrmex barbatus]